MPQFGRIGACLGSTPRLDMLRGDVEGTFLTLILHTVVHVGAHTQEIVAVTRLQLREAYQFMQ